MSGDRQNRLAPYRQARSMVIQSALRSPQSLSLMLVALLGFGLSISMLGGPPALWLLFGAVGVLIFMFTTLTDPQAVAAAYDRMLLNQYNPNAITNLRARLRLQQALEYVENIQRLAAQRGGAMRVQVEATVSEINEWLEQIHKIARRIDLYEENSLINRDRARVPDELKLLHQRLANESDESVKKELEETVRLRETQLSNLRALEVNIKRADIQLDNTLAALGTIYAQVQLLDAKEVDGRRANRLRQEIHDEVLSLKDTIEALDDVQNLNSYGAS